MFGFIGKMLMGWRQPAVKATETVNLETQRDVPHAKIRGVFYWSAVAAISLYLLALTVDPSRLYSYILYILGGCLVVSAILTFFLWGHEQRSAIFGVMLSVGFAAIMGGWVKSSEAEWWFEFLHPALLHFLRLIFGCAVLAGITGVYWFVKELIMPYELTGLDRVIDRMLRKISEYLPELLEAELDASGEDDDADTAEILKNLQADIRTQVADGLADVARVTRVPGRSSPIGEPTVVAINRQWTLDLMSWLLMASWMDVFSRKAWVDDVPKEEEWMLPSGLAVNHSTHAIMVKQLIEVGVLMKTSRGPILALEGKNLDEFVGYITLLTCPPKLMGHYSGKGRRVAT
jgi:hypothetical protein